MINRPKRIAAVAAALATTLALTACAALKPLDVVGRHSISSFGAVLQAIPDNVTGDTAGVGWALAAPDGSARFLWGADLSQTPPYGVMLAVEAAPFVDAGLDPSLLPDDYTVNEGEIIVGARLFDGAPEDGDQTALSAYERIVDARRDVVTYHASLDHFGVKLGGGNMFEWAKDMKGNGNDGTNQDKDIVFVLSPEPLIAAGVDPEKVEGWAYAPVLADEDGKMAQVWKFLKPFDLQ